MTLPRVKLDGLECRVWNCQEQDPRHSVTWKCGNGHREEFWYCDGHIAGMTELAIGSCLFCRECGASSFARTEGSLL